VHNYFAMFEIELRGTNSWYKIVDKGWLTAMSDPEVRAMANRWGDPEELLSYDWVPVCRESIVTRITGKTMPLIPWPI